MPSYSHLISSHTSHRQPQPPRRRHPHPLPHPHDARHRPSRTRPQQRQPRSHGRHRHLHQNGIRRTSTFTPSLPLLHVIQISPISKITLARRLTFSNSTPPSRNSSPSPAKSRSSGSLARSAPRTAIARRRRSSSIRTSPVCRSCSTRWRLPR